MATVGTSKYQNSIIARFSFKAFSRGFRKVAAYTRLQNAPNMQTMLIVDSLVQPSPPWETSDLAQSAIRAVCILIIYAKTAKDTTIDTNILFFFNIIKASCPEIYSSCSAALSPISILLSKGRLKFYKVIFFVSLNFTKARINPNIATIDATKQAKENGYLAKNSLLLKLEYFQLGRERNPPILGPIIMPKICPTFIKVNTPVRFVELVISVAALRATTCPATSNPATILIIKAAEQFVANAKNKLVTAFANRLSSNTDLRPYLSLINPSGYDVRNQAIE